jgi:hypothetical protein
MGDQRLVLSTQRVRTFQLVRSEQARGLEPRTFRLQDASSVLTMASTSDFTVYSDRSDHHSGSNGREFASRVMSRRRASAVIFR